MSDLRLQVTICQRRDDRPEYDSWFRRGEIDLVVSEQVAWEVFQEALRRTTTPPVKIVEILPDHPADWELRR